MLAADGTPATCFSLTSPLLANTSVAAPPPSSNSSSRKKTRLTLNSLPRYTHASNAAQTGSIPCASSQSHYQYGSQYGNQYSTQYSQQYAAQYGAQYSTHQYPTYSSQYPPQQSYLSAQQQLQLHQKDLIQQATRVTIPSHMLFPVSPRLIPCGSPGPVTPLTLEESQGGYLYSGSSNSSMPFFQQRDMDKLAAIAAAQN